MAVVGDAGSAWATEVEERVAVPDKEAVLDKVAVLDELAWGKGGLTGVPVATFLTFSVTILAKSFLGCLFRRSMVVLFRFELFHIVARYPHHVVFNVFDHFFPISI